MIRKKVSFLTAVWGKAYIERFSTLALPSFMATGNLPALAGQFDLEVVIMTRGSDIPLFDQHQAFSNLSSNYRVRFVEIDDLIADHVYGVTLTLAYLRPIVAYGQEMLNRHFVFMNADFVLADGSLRSLAKHINADRAIVLGPSFRAVAEDLEPTLYRLVDKASGILQIQTRELVRLSLPYPHITTIAKTQSQSLCHSIHPNQFFWKVDQAALLGRYFLIFMLCLKPERVISAISSYCDYAFIPELCPSGDEVAMGDSDDFFMLELQQREQEKGLIHLGKASAEMIAGSLQFWTTAEHRRASEYDILFHSGEVAPEKLLRAKKEASTFIENIKASLKTPKPHQDHYYWIHGVAAWQYHRRKRGVTENPPELALTTASLNVTEHFTDAEHRHSLWHKFTLIRKQSLSMSLSLMYASQIKLAKFRGNPIHPRWLEYRHLKATFHPLVTQTGERVLMLQNTPGAVDNFFAGLKHITIADSSEISTQTPPQICESGSGSGYTTLAICLNATSPGEVINLIHHCQGLMAKSFHCHVFMMNVNFSRNNESVRLALLDLASSLSYRINPASPITFTGGRTKWLMTRFFSKLLGHYIHFGLVALTWIAPLLLISLPVAALVNLYCRSKQPYTKEVEFCSSIALEFVVERDH